MRDGKNINLDAVKVNSICQLEPSRQLQ